MSVNKTLVDKLNAVGNNPALLAVAPHFKTKLALRNAAFQLGLGNASNLEKKPDLVKNVLLPVAIRNANAI